MSGCGDMGGTKSQEIHTWLLLYGYQILFVCKLYLELKVKRQVKQMQKHLVQQLLLLLINASIQDM